MLAIFAALPTDPTLFLLYDDGIARVVLVVLTVVVTLHLHDLYTDLYVKSRVMLLQQLCMVVGIAFLLQGLISYIDPTLRMPLRVMVAGSAMANEVGGIRVAGRPSRTSHRPWLHSTRPSMR